MAELEEIVICPLDPEKVYTSMDELTLDTDEGPCTLFKCSGDLSRHFAAEARILETPFSEMLCRTQVRLALNDFSYFLTDPIGNPHLLCKGSHAEEIEAFFELLGEKD